MVVDFKKIFILSVLVLMFATMSQSVIAADSLASASSNIVANLTGIGKFTANDLKDGELGTSNQFWSSTVSQYVSFLKNDTYQLNITVHNYNGTSNITEVLIHLPTGLTFITGTNATASESVQSRLTGDKIHFSSSSNRLNWSSNIGLIPNISATTPGSRTFIFNVTSAISGQNFVNFTIEVRNITRNLAQASEVNNFTIGDKLYLDGKLPTFDSAKTNDTASINMTFSEAINVSTVKPMLATYVNRTGSTLNLTISGVSSTNNDSIVTLIAGDFEGNLTPTLTLNSSSITYITDLAGNSLTTNTSVTTTDGASPFLRYSVLNISGTGIATLTLFWSEPVSTISSNPGLNKLILMSGNNAKEGNYINATVLTSTSNTSSSYSGNLSEVVFNASESANISNWKVNSFNFSLSSSAWKDYSGNTLLRSIDGITADSIIDVYSNDTTAPTLSSWTYNHNQGLITLTFNEYMDAHYYYYSLNLSNSTAFTGTYFKPETRLEGGVIQLNSTYVTSVYKTNLGTSVSLNLSVWARDKIAEWDQMGMTTLYLGNLNSTNKSFTDAAGNFVAAMGHGTSTVYSTVTTWTQDSTAPTVLSATISNTNVTGPGSHRLRVTFNENITNKTTVTLTKGSTSFTTYNFTYIEALQTSIVDLYYNFTTDDTNGEWVINVSTAKDLSGNSLTDTNTGLKFTYDSVAPYILYSYYLENGTTDAPYNGTLNIGDTLIMVFSEQLQPWTGLLATGNFSFRDGGAMCSDVCNVSITTNKVTLTANAVAPNISLRGEWLDVVDGSAIQKVGNATEHRNLNKNGTSWFIRDKANNFARDAHSTAQKVVIADYALEVTNSTPITVSFPACVNTGNMTSYLNANDYSFIYYYNADTWGTHTTTTSLRPLVGYRFTWLGTNSYLSTANDNMFRFYLKNESDCSLTDLEIDIKDGWNFLALNGNYYSARNTNGVMGDNVDNWLLSLTSTGAEAGIAVDSIIKDYGNTTIYRNVPNGGDVDWDNLIIKPYESWWVQSTAANSFTGVGRR